MHKTKMDCNFKPGQRFKFLSFFLEILLIKFIIACSLCNLSLYLGVIHSFMLGMHYSSWL